MAFTLPPGVAEGSGESIYLATQYLIDHPPTPPRVAGRWYSPINGLMSAGTALLTNSIRMAPFFIEEEMTISALGAVITTLSAGGNIQLAIYAADAVTGTPTGEALALSGSLSTAAAAAVSANLAENVALDRGLYWMAVNSDNSVAVCKVPHGSLSQGSYLIGSTTLATALGNATGSSLLYTLAQTFGTWPDMTGQTFTESTGANCAAIFLKAA